MPVQHNSHPDGASGAPPPTAEDAHPPPIPSDDEVQRMSLVDIAAHLERTAQWIENQRARERRARAAYEALAQEVHGAIAAARATAARLVQVQQRRLRSVSGLIGVQGRAGSEIEAKPGRRRLNIADAILAVWTLPERQRPLSSDEIGMLLNEIGYVSQANPRSLKSSVNQALAKLCRDGRVMRIRSDGTRIPSRDTRSRARKYVAATLPAIPGKP